MIFRIIGMVGVGGLFVVIAAVVVLSTRGADVFKGMLPEKLAQSFAQDDQAGGSGQIGAGTTDSVQIEAGQTAATGPAQYLQDGPDGLFATGAIAAAQANVPVYIDDIIQSYKATPGDDAPAEIMTIRPITGCRLTPPQAGTRVGHVTAGNSGLELPLITYSDTDIATAVQEFVDLYRKGESFGPDRHGPIYEAYDVAVTETSVPVYLVLENGGGNRIWNIHVAEGAMIERVVLLGGSQAGVANLDPVVPVEVILASGLEDCGIQPAYSLNKGHALLQSVQRGQSSQAELDAKLAAITSAVAAYDIWFRDSFGIRAEETRAGFDRGTISLVGPVPVNPAPKAVFAPIKGAKVRTTQDTYFEIRGQTAEGEDFVSQVKAIATDFAFGDLTYLRQGVSF